MMNDELISEPQKAVRHVASPARLTAGRCTHLSLPACTSYLFIAIFRLPCCFCLSFFDSLTVCLLLFLSSSVLHGMCVSVFCVCGEALVPSRSYQLAEATSLATASNETPDDTSHYSKHGYVNTKESPKEESQFSRRHLRGRHFTFCSVSATTGD